VSGIDMQTGISHDSSLGFACEMSDLKRFVAWLAKQINESN